MNERTNKYCCANVISFEIYWKQGRNVDIRFVWQHLLLLVIELTTKSDSTKLFLVFYFDDKHFWERTNKIEQDNECRCDGGECSIPKTVAKVYERRNLKCEQQTHGMQIKMIMKSGVSTLNQSNRKRKEYQSHSNSIMRTNEKNTHRSNAITLTIQ